MLGNVRDIGFEAWPGARGEVSAADALERLLLAARPIVRDVVSRRFHSARDVTPEDREDVCSDAIAALLTRLRRVREGGGAIESFDSYAAGIASHAADSFFARRSPLRARLRLRLRYVLTTGAEFRFAANAEGAWVCGLSGTASLQPASPLQVEALQSSLSSRILPAGKLRDLVREILRISGRPLLLADMTSLTAYVLGVADRTEPLEDIHPAESPSIAARVEIRDWLSALWGEISALPARHRGALLLNMGSADGTTMCLLVELGIVSFAALAGALEVTESELAALWNRVPLPDLEVAERFGLVRQQVINLRRTAREKLSRRFANMREKSHTGIADGLQANAFQAPGGRAAK